MRILFISSGNAKNGISPIVKNQGESLKGTGADVDFFTIQGNGMKGYLKSISILRKYLKNKSYDIIHAHYGLSGITAWLGKKKQPLIVSFMGDDLLGSNRTDGRRTIFSRFLVGLNIFMARFFYDFSIVKSEEMLRKLPGVQAEVIPNGVNMDFFYPENQQEVRKRMDLLNNEKIVVFISNPNRPEKNYALAQKAVDSIEKYPIRLEAIYGKSQEEVRDWINAADVCVLTSFHEGSPNVIKEAMACNCPIVSTDVGDVKDVFGNVDGCYIGTYEVNEFSIKLINAIKFSVKQRSSNGRNRILEMKLNSENVAKRINELYKKTLKIAKE